MCPIAAECRRIAARLLAAAALATLAATAAQAQLFAYVPVPELDLNGKPIIDPETGKTIDDGFCLVWKQGWVLDNPDLEVIGAPFYTRVSYRADPRLAQLTVYAVTAPSVVAIKSGAGWYPVGGDSTLRVDITAPLLPQPKADWPCSRETWEAVLNAPERDYPGQEIVLPGTGRGTSLPEYRERQRRIACDNPQIPGNRQRCQQR